MDEIKVTICCITYNHENYIRDALDSFIMQETDFKYEILIHDDCSTDNTRTIIEEYKRKYPEMIKTIYQKENQFSKKKKIFSEFVFPKARGKYIAICEGDDYWLDKEKLKKQVQILESDCKIVATVSGSECVNDEKCFKGYIRSYEQNTIINLKKFLNDYYKKLPIHLFQMASIVFRRSIYEELYEQKIEFYHKCPVGDLPLYLLLLTKGEIYYFKDIMAAYRQDRSGSWTETVWKKQRENILKRMLETYKQFDLYTKHMYINEISPFILKYEFDILLLNLEYKKLLKKKYKTFFNQLNFRSKISILVHSIID